MTVRFQIEEAEQWGRTFEQCSAYAVEYREKRDIKNARFWAEKARYALKLCLGHREQALLQGAA